LDPCNYALSSSGSRMGTFLQNETGGAWGGVHILIDPGAIGYSNTLEDLNNDVLYLDNFNVGNEVQVTGVVTNFSGFTQVALLPINSTIESFSTLPDPIVMSIDSFMVSDGGGGQIIARNPGEKYEGVYVELQDVFVTDVDPSGDRFFWTIKDAVGNGIQVRDMSGHFRNDANDDECPDWLDGTPGVSYTPTTFAPPSLGSNLTYLRGVLL
ncbi:MAG: hypothetical protein GY751_15140, partial [Bacteroidetes bacterium]|nr:hypothetical protein [Bacteroidota bacterium]